MTKLRGNEVKILYEKKGLVPRITRVKYESLVIIHSKVMATVKVSATSRQKDQKLYTFESLTMVSKKVLLIK